LNTFFFKQKNAGNEAFGTASHSSTSEAQVKYSANTLDDFTMDAVESMEVNIS
jgi:hypothetical protein